MTRPTVASIDLGALAHNLGVACGLAGTARVLAVAKADAYGHGLTRVWRAWSQAAGIAVLELDAAVRLREQGYRGRVVLLEGCFEADEIELVERFDLVPVVHEERQLAMLSGFRPARPLPVLLKLNKSLKTKYTKQY